MRILTLNEAGLVAGGRSVQPNLFPGPGSGGGYSGGGYGYFAGSYSGGGDDLPPIDITSSINDYGGFDTSITIANDAIQVQAVTHVDASAVQTPVFSPDVAAAVATFAQAYCDARLKRPVTCAAVNVAISSLLQQAVVSDQNMKGMNELTKVVTHLGM